ncbi:MAG: hypothetical protein ACJAZ2_001374 [Glaciecola sp.]|jgi:hypothetical protein
MLTHRLFTILCIAAAFLSCTNITETDKFNNQFISSQINSLNSEIYVLQRSYQEIKKKFSNTPDSIKCIPSINTQLKINEANVLKLTQQIDREASFFSDILFIKKKEKGEFNPVNLIDSISLNSNGRISYNTDTILRQIRTTVQSFQKTIDTDGNYRNDWLAYSFKIHCSFKNGEIKNDYSEYLNSKKNKWERYIDLITIKKEILHHHLIILTSLNKK